MADNNDVANDDDAVFPSEGGAAKDWYIARLQGPEIAARIAQVPEARLELIRALEAIKCRAEPAPQLLEDLKAASQQSEAWVRDRLKAMQYPEIYAAQHPDKPLIFYEKLREEHLGYLEDAAALSHVTVDCEVPLSGLPAPRVALAPGQGPRKS